MASPAARGEGATELNEPPWVLHWLRDSSLALPVVAIGVWLGSQLAARLVVARYTCLAPRKLLDAVLPVCLALYASTVLAAGNPLHGALFAAQHDGHDLPLVVHVLRDRLVALSGNLVVALGLAACLTWRPRIAVSPSRCARGGIALLMVTGTSLSTAAPTAAQSGPGNLSSPCPTGAPLKMFAVTALEVKIPLNRFGDNDPFGKMFVLNQHINDVRAEEATQQVSIGLRGRRYPAAGDSCQRGRLCPDRLHQQCQRR